MFICRHCGNHSKKPTANSLRNHERTCSENKERKYINGMTGKKAWNKGLTQKSNPELASKLCAGGKAVGKLIKEGLLQTVPSLQTYWTPERREQKSQWRIQLHKTNPETHPNRRLAGNRNKMTYPEKVAFDWLVLHKLEFEHQKKIDTFYVDFCINNVVIEIDGEHWHDADKDLARDNKLRELGYVIFRIKAKERIEERLKEIIGV